MRGTFANIRIKNKLVPGVEGGYTVFQGQRTGDRSREQESGNRSQGTGVRGFVHLRCRHEVSGGRRPDHRLGRQGVWDRFKPRLGGKGPRLLGVKAVIAESFERIHRSNLVGMGVLPLQFLPGQNAESLGLTGFEVFDILGISGAEMQAKQKLTVRATAADGSVKTFETISRIDTPVEVGYYRNGGILQTVLRQMMSELANDERRTTDDETCFVLWAFVS